MQIKGMVMGLLQGSCKTLLRSAVLASAFAMTGVAWAAPVVTMTAPANNSFGNAPIASLPLTATASDSSGTITKVEFYDNGSTLLGTATTAPYSYNMPNPANGWHGFTAKAYNNLGASTVSATIGYFVNQLPTVRIDTPLSGTAIATGSASIPLSVYALDPDGSITKIELYNGATLLSTQNPGGANGSFNFTINNPVAGTYNLTAKAYDLRNAASTSAVTQLFVENAPTVTLTSPANGAVVTLPAGASSTSVNLTATAADSDGSVVKVDYYVPAGTYSGYVLGPATTPPYAVTWNYVKPGTYNIVARAYDNRGLMTTSVLNTLIVNSPPAVTLTSPSYVNAYGTTIPSGTSSFTLTSIATDSDGTVSKVEYYRSSTVSGPFTTLIGSSATSPYNYVWNAPPDGNYFIIARAYDKYDGTADSTVGQLHVDHPPIVTLTAPRSGTVFKAPAQITMSVNASDSDGSVAAVSYYSGSTLVGSTSGTNSVTWNNVPAGTYSLNAVAVDNYGLASAPSAASQITVINDSGPTVIVTSPANGGAGTAPATVTLTATATPVAGAAITGVQFYQNNTAVGPLLTASPYTYSWVGVAAGSYSIKAIATDNAGVSTSSAAIAYTISNPLLPSVSVIGPANNANFRNGAVIPLSATATAVNSTVASVQFYDGATLIGSGTASGNSYSYSWTGASAGTHTITAKVTDSLGNFTASSAITVNVITDAGPTVTITSPVSGGSSTPPANITLTATATAISGQTIAGVQFYQGSTAVGPVLTTAPYTYSWAGVAAGRYSITAKATDSLNAVTTSAAVSYTVSPSSSPSSGIYYVYPDQIDTPRAVVRSSDNQMMWRWDQVDPFGSAPPNSNPAGAGTFTYNQRFPGQVADAENNLNYNYFRNYDPGQGRYVSSDLLGFNGGINTYTYVTNNPAAFMDPLGLRRGSTGWSWLDNALKPIDGSQCATGECAAGLLPTKPDFRPQCKVDVAQCNLVCQMVLLPVTTAGNIAIGGKFLGLVAGNLMKFEVCKKVCN